MAAREIDLTWWLAAGGLGLFLLMLVVAVVLYTLSQLAQFSIAPTAAVAAAPTVAATSAASASSTLAPTTVGGMILADTPTVSSTPTLSPMPTLTMTPTPAPPTASLTPAGTPTPVVYLVRDGDTLGAIAQVYGLSMEDILKVNRDVKDPDNLDVGQALIIPVVLPPTATAGATLPPTQGPTLTAPLTPLPTAPPTAVALASLPRSIVEGDLAGNYPLTLAGPRVTIHYQPGSFTDLTDPQLTLKNAEQALSLVERTLNVTYSGPLDVYLAGSLFAAPNQALRQRPYPTQRRVFLLYDGSGTPEERRYLLAHEMTHLVAWHAYGVPSTVMLSEGLATYVGQSYLEGGGFIKYQDFCRALARTNRLPSLQALENSVQGFLDPVRSLPNYDAAACFVGYLFDLKGSASFSQLYPTSNYPANYGLNPVQLEDDFARAMSSGAFQITFDPQRLMAYYDEASDGYARLFANPDPDLTAYETLDDARIATLTGNFDGARALLDQFHVLVK